MYLDSPLFFTKKKSKYFEYSKEKIESKLNSWASKCLSWAGRATMIGSIVLQATNVNNSTFKIPNKICEVLDAILNFGGNHQMCINGRYLALKACDDECYSLDSVGDWASRSSGISIRNCSRTQMAQFTKPNPMGPASYKKFNPLHIRNSFQSSGIKRDLTLTLVRSNRN